MTCVRVIKSACCILALTVIALLNYRIYFVIHDFRTPLVLTAVHQDPPSPAKDTNHHDQDTADGNIAVQGDGSRSLQFVSEDYYDRPQEHSPHMEHQPPADMKVNSELPNKEVPTTKPTLSTEIPKAESPTPEHTSTSGASGGFVLAEGYWEQQNSGCRNFQFLLCWAGRLNLTVVEPFMQDSVLRTHLSAPHPPRHGPTLLRLSDLFNTDIWNKYSRQRHHASIVPWEYFLQNAPRDLITVQLKYKQGEQDQKGEPSPSERIKTGCNKAWPSQSQIDFLKTKGFRIVRGVCLNFAYGDHFTMQQFHQYIYGSYSPNETTVVFRQWRGIGSRRVFISDAPCQASLLQSYLVPSLRLVADAEKYIDKYLPVGRYVAIMVRMEKAKITLRKTHAKGIIPFCFGKLVKYWNATKVASGIKTLFLSIDMGKYGSNSFRDSGDGTDLLTEFTKFGREVYGSTFSVSQWESTFEEIGQTTDAGYIALLQKVIVTRASCVIFLGGGSFQRHTLYLYQKLHPKREEWCVRFVAECIGNRDKNKLTSLLH